MKKTLYSILFASLVLLSCKKERSKSPSRGEQPLYKVAFSVGFTQQITNFQANGSTRFGIHTRSVDTTLKNQIDILYYAVYDSLGNNVHTAKQLSTDTAFGRYNDNLHQGRYTVVIAGGKTGFKIGPNQQGKTGLSNDILSYVDSYSAIIPPTQDIFFKKINITVSPNAVSQNNVSLDRVTSQLTVVIKDAIPPNTKFVELNMYSSWVARWFNVGSGTVGGDFRTLYYKNLTSADIVTSNFTYSVTLLYSQPMTIDLFAASNAYGSSIIDTKLGEKIITNVICQPNTQTILSGNLFGGAGTTGTTGGSRVIIDTAWSSSSISRTFP